MYRKVFFIVFLLATVTLSDPAARSQDDTCPAIVQTALASIKDLCSDTARNQACYGSVTLTAEAREGAESFAFETPGDIVNVADIQSLVLSPMDEAAGEWGISLMKLQVNLPETLPGQNVTVLLFGDVEIENAVGDSSDDYTPMQAFYFRSGIGDSSCAEGPESGILIQTPKGTGEVELVVNEVNIALGSTAFLQAVPDNALYVNLIEGQAKVTAFDETKTVLAGMMVRVPLDENLAASGPPNVPEPSMHVATLSSVVEILPEPIVPSESEATAEAEPVVDESAACSVTAGGNVNLRSGPGTVYGRAGGLAAGSSTEPTGQAMGTDGYAWYQLADGSWVRSDVVKSAGSCGSLPVVADTPPVPTAAPTTASMPTTDNPTADNPSGEDASNVIFSPEGCTVVITTRSARLMYGAGGFPSCEEAQAATNGSLATFSGNGPAPSRVYSTSCYMYAGTYGVNTTAEIIFSPGVYTYTANWIHGERTCNITVK